MNRWLHPRKWLSLPLRFHNILFFLAGFLLEALPMVRRDTWASLAIQLAFLSGAAVLLVSRTWERSGVWRPGMVLSWAWSYQEELYYFLYGYLLNAYAIFFLKDRAVIWFLLWAALLVLMLFINEIPRVHWHIHRFRLIFFAFCAAAFSALALSTVHQWPGGGVFVFSLGLSAVLTGGLAVAMSDPGAGRRR
ncbi:MAG: hypothetical protein HY548_06080, partial [Elusimicrobia bacterium]|nr:hypothetical protein [Elusimicrobiota bacterium]